MGTPKDNKKQQQRFVTNFLANKLQMAKVTLRERKLSKGRKRYYLDIYHGHGKREYEFLFVVEKNDDKKEKKKLAETKALQRATEIQSQGTNYIPKHKRNLKLYDYLDSYHTAYTKKDKRVISAVIEKVKEFENNRDFLVTDITKDFILKFIDYLNNDAGLQGESPKTYFRRFKKILLQANRDRVLDENVYKDINFKTTHHDENTLTKEVLSEEEINTLFDVDCGNSEVKKAFLTACYSGIGYAEVKKLKWKDIKNDRLITKRSKTGTEINLKLSPKILEILGEPKEPSQPIFDITRNGKFISENGVNKTLKNWVKRAKINKNITFYCGRHTFACRLLIKGANLKTVSDALAHKSTATTIKYLNHVNSLKDEATANL